MFDFFGNLSGFFSSVAKWINYFVDNASDFVTESADYVQGIYDALINADIPNQYASAISLAFFAAFFWFFCAAVKP